MLIVVCCIYIDHNMIRARKETHYIQLSIIVVTAVQGDSYV